jgi:acetyl esterase/lipase
MHRLHAAHGVSAVTIRDVFYRDGLASRLYLPAGSGPFPGLVAVHGGSWCYGDRLMHESTAQRLAARGIAIMAIDFRMPPQARYPDPIADVAAAIEWLGRTAPELSLDAGRIGGLGFSSGAHQLLLAALAPSDPRWSAGAVRCGMLIAAFGVTDPLARYRMARSRSLTRLLEAHDAYWPDERAMAEGNPQLLVERGEAECLPALLVLQGTADENLTGDMAERFVRAYREAGGDATLALFDGEPHAFLDRSPDSAASLRAVDLIVEFVLGAGKLRLRRAAP